ncbi:MAG: carboxypeptidase-like regulatory domain-containing protein [Bacteroidota bacterium]
MKSLRLTILAICLFSASYGQEYRLTLSVLNAENREPVPYATIMFVEQQYGFSANSSGRFSLRVNKVEFQRKLNISSIGFEDFTITLGDLIEKDINEILLKPKVTILDELMVRAEAESPSDIIRKSTKLLPEFLGNAPYYLHMFYKESLLQHNRHVGFTEGYGIMHVTDYVRAQRTKNELFKLDLVQWKNIRRSDYELKDDCDTLKSRKLGIAKLMKAKTEYFHRGPLTKGFIDQYKYNIDSLTSYHGHDVFVIGFQPKQWTEEDQIQGQIYINADDYALLSIRVSQRNSKTLFFNNCKIPSSKSEFKLTFTQVSKQYFIKELYLKNTFMDIEEEIKIIGGEFQVNKVQRLNYDQRVVLYNEMINPAISYNSEFWKDHGDDISALIIKDLTHDTSLYEQFVENTGKRLEPLPPRFKDYRALYSDRNVFKLYFNGDL